ncbi:MAG: OsmC family protein [Actinobacteria bacterium]|nr:OsmC family protein [Actinomycetota bacterium]
MDRSAFQALQAPLKERYRAEPRAAVITLRADGRLGEEEMSCSVDTGRALVEAGLHPATGGSGTLACSGDMLLQALVACAGVTLCAVAMSLEIPVRGGTVMAEGDLDFRGTLGVSKEAPVGFTDIRLRFELDTDATSEQLDTLLRLTERYCVVHQTLIGSPTVAMSFRSEQPTPERRAAPDRNARPR